MGTLIATAAVIPAALIYFGIGFIYWMIAAFAAGFSGNQMNRSDFYGSMLWPISISMLIGQLVRIYLERKKK